MGKPFYYSSASLRSGGNSSSDRARPAASWWSAMGGVGAGCRLHQLGGERAGVRLILAAACDRANLNPVNNIQIHTNGKAFGTRLRFYPFPLDSNLGRLELGASTYNGKWLNGNWFNSWGVDYAYLNGNLQSRGEYVQTYRQMPAASGPDNRQGWYVQFGYFLQNVPLPALPFGIENQIHKLELLTRYSGVNQRAIVAEEISASPELAFNGSPSIFTPHSREIALGVDYWIEPSIVWQTEFDIELPRAGGTLFSFNGASTPTASSVGATPNDRAILTQFAIGF
jgi:hypothetical protein